MNFTTILESVTGIVQGAMVEVLVIGIAIGVAIGVAAVLVRKGRSKGN